MLMLPLKSTVLERDLGRQVAGLFGAGEQGGWYDVSDMSTLFQDAAGATPVTAVGQPVGRILDKSGRGNHATQATTTKRPVLSRLVNLLTNTGFAGAATGTPGTAPTGWSFVLSGGSTLSCTTSDGAGGFVLEFGASGNRQFIAQGTSVLPPNSSARFTVLLVATSGLPLSQLVVVTGAPSGAVATLTVNGVEEPSNHLPVAGDVIGATVTIGSTAGNVTLRLGVGTSGTATGQASFAKASFVMSTDAHLPYQRVNTATDYDADPAKFPAYLRFDGVDDALQTGNIDFTSTDKMTVWAGVTALDMVRASGAPGQLLYSNGDNFNGFGLRVPLSGGFISFVSSGNVAIAEPTSSYHGTAPANLIMCGYGDQVAPLAVLRSNGVQRSVVNTVQGTTGGYGNRSMWLASQSGISRFFNGRLYSLIVRGAQTPLSQIEATELYIKQKMRLP